MSIKKKPVVIKLEGEEDRQKFLNWALGKSEPTKGIHKAKAAMLLARQNEGLPDESDSEVISTLGYNEPPLAHASRRIKGGWRTRNRHRKNVIRTRDGKHGVAINNRRG